MITFVGHLTKDINVDNARREERIEVGGGVLYGSITAALLGVETVVLAKCAREDFESFRFLLQESGVKVFLLESRETTTIRNEYYSLDPDNRESYLVKKADPFTRDDLSYIPYSDVIHINPLWYGEFEEEHIPLLRKKTGFLSADAQGFLRRVEKGGKMVYGKWLKKEYLPFLDFLKVDIREAKSMTGESELKKACKVISSFGPKYIMVTHTNGVVVFDGNFHEAPFEGWILPGRTGRGDTCAAAFLVAFLFKGMKIEVATKFSAKITSLKMLHPGPLRREDVETLTGSWYI